MAFKKKRFCVLRKKRVNYSSFSLKNSRAHPVTLDTYLTSKFTRKTSTNTNENALYGVKTKITQRRVLTIKASKALFF